MNKQPVLLDSYINASFFCAVFASIASFFVTSVRESFLYKTIRDMPSITGRIKAVYFGLFIFAVTLGHVKSFFNLYMGCQVSFKPFFYTFIFVGFLFFIAPLRLDEITSGSCFLKGFWKKGYQASPPSKMAKIINGSLLLRIFRSGKCAG